MCRFLYRCRLMLIDGRCDRACEVGPKAKFEQFPNQATSPDPDPFILVVRQLKGVHLNSDHSAEYDISIDSFN